MVEDLENGTYHINLWFAIPCMVKLMVNMDKNLPPSVAELPTMVLHCTDPPPEMSAPAAVEMANANRVLPARTAQQLSDTNQALSEDEPNRM